MKNLIIIFFLFFPVFSFSYGQNQSVAVCITKTTYMVFDTPVKEYNVGTRDVQIHTNLISSSVLSLQAKPGVTDENYIKTNLFVLLETGAIFYFDIVLDETRENYMYNFQNTDAVEIQTNAEVKSSGEQEKQKTPNFEYEENYTKVLALRDMFANASVSLQESSLALNAIGYKDNMLYFKFTVKNTSGIDYDIEYIKFMKRLKNRGKTQSFQEMELPVADNMPHKDKLEKGQQNAFVFVLNKLTLSRDEEILLEVKEAQGERNLSIVIPAYFITSAKKL